MKDEVPLVPEIRPGEVTQRKPGDYLVRFAFGAGISLVAGIIGMVFGAQVGGVLLAFPAILPASLTLIEKKEGKEEASVDSMGAILGAIAMVGFAIAMSLWVTRFGVVASLAIALAIWLVVAGALYALVATAFHRQPHAP